jgi:DUF4097 and DUF4098 domain-containing protein YvlB
VSLDNVNGNVRILTWDKAEIQVDAVKRGKKQVDMDRLKIEINSKEDSIRIKSKYASSKPRDGKNDSASVDYVLTVPKQSRLDKVSTVNGGVEIENVGGDVEAGSVNGPVTANGLEGEVELSTVNGTLKAGVVELKKPVSLKSVNGSVTLAVPSDANANVSADTINGSINNQFSLQAKSHFPVGKSLDGKLGDGGSKIKMSTVNGAIHLDRAKTVAQGDR